MSQEELVEKLAKVCDDCLNCAHYWQNTDTENECEGQNEPCHEYIEFKGIGQ